VMIHSIYFGGGTPSILDLIVLENIINTIYKTFTIDENVEINLECNPGTVDLHKLDNYKAFGINRLSFGAQSFDDSELALLGRIHNAKDIFDVVAWARRAGFENVSLDLIFGLPNQKLETWLNSLKNAVTLQLEHLSLYGLTIEEGTKLREWIKLGKLADIDDDFAADCYEEAQTLLEKSHYVHYEISNWAKKGADENIFTCRHNQQYWRNLPYYGFGAGAHGFIHNLRIANVLHPKDYIERLKKLENYEYPLSPATNYKHPVEKEEEMNDTLMLGLRLLIEGVSLEEFRKRFEVDLFEQFGTKINKLISRGLVELVEDDQQRIRLTKKAYFIGNIVFREFV
ncbi:MAG: radical SAM family heme chaperone HemW, partial [Anaerolineales bacterium]